MGSSTGVRHQRQEVSSTVSPRVESSSPVRGSFFFCWIFFCSNTILADLTEWSIYGKPRITTTTTRMHSSRMRTGRSLTVCCSPLPGGGVLPAWSLGGGFSLPGPGGGGVLPARSLTGDPLPPVSRITHTCKNITLATTSLRPVTMCFRTLMDCSVNMCFRTLMDCSVNKQWLLRNRPLRTVHLQVPSPIAGKYFTWSKYLFIKSFSWLTRKGILCK